MGRMGSCGCCCLGRNFPRMEIASSLEEKIVSSRKKEEQRNNVVDFDFLFEFSPERRSTEPQIHFEQDQRGQGGEEQQQQTEGSGGRNRRAEVRPYPTSEMRSTNKLEKSRQSARECRARKKTEIPVLGRHDPGTREGERCTSGGAGQVCRLVSDARSESGARRSAGVAYNHPGILEVRKCYRKKHCQRIQSVCDQK